MTQTLGDVLLLPVMHRARLLTPEHQARSRAVAGVSVIEVPVERFVRRGELVLSTGMGVGHDETLLTTFVKDIATAGAAALALSLGPYTTTVPTSVVKLASTCGLPLMTLPWEARFSDIIGDVLRRLIEEQGVLRLRDDFVWSLVNGTSTSETWGLAQGRRFGIDLTGPHFALVGELELPSDVQAAEVEAARSVLDSILRQLAGRGRAAFGVTIGSSVVLFVQGGQGPGAQRWVEEVLLAQDAANTAFWSWGVSGSVRGTRRYREAYQEARLALQVGRRARGVGQVTHGAQVLADRVLLEAVHSNVGQEMRKRVERRLSTLSKRSGAVAWSTLEAYVETGGNVSQCARRLRLHRQSLLHRLELLQVALGWDLSNSEDRFALELAVRLRRVARAAERAE